ncbi:MAG: ABC transporter ATP-binding protein [Armatimonadetes bacterium]|nr:ABC transporter ATP-binding protein [Armatimonadota bacterium]
MWQEPLPEGVRVEGDLRLCLESDAHPGGDFGKEWLVVAGQEVRVFSQNGAGVEERYRLPFDQISDPKAEPLIGGGALEVTHDGQRLELIAYTNARAARFATAAAHLEKWLKGEEAPLPEEEARRCPRCGLPLEAGTQVCPACLPRHRTAARLTGYLRPYVRQAVLLAALAFANTALGLIPPWLQKPLVDKVLSPGAGAAVPGRLRLLALLVLALLGARILMAAISMAQGWLAAWLGNHITHDIRCQLYRHLQYLSLSFFDKRQMGSVISRVNQDTGQLQQLLVWGSQDLATNLLLLVGIGAMLFLMNWKLALFVLAPAPVIFFFSSRFWKRIRYFMHRFFHNWGRLNSILSETLTGLRVVKAFAQEPRVVTRFQERSRELAVTGIEAERVWVMLFSGMSLFIMLGTLLVWYVGGRDVLFGRMSLGTLIAFLTYVGMFYSPLQFLSMLLNWASRSLTAAERVFEVLDSQPDVQEAENPTPMPNLSGRVEFKDVSFGYDRHRPVVKQITFEAAPGEMLGLVGHSGAGKTTSINLLCRFYDAQEGEILIDGVPIRQIRLEDLRHQIGLVPQDTFLFSGTLAENIAYAKPDATKEEVIRAAKVANAHDFIRSRPEGYETLVGEGGQGLSAGERQRIAIARAVLHNPRILILDEATSHVDVETEKQIQTAIERLVAGRTTFAIAHRLSTLKNANRLLVLKNGEIAEMGTHDELLAQEGGEFHRLVATYQEISKVQAVER